MGRPNIRAEQVTLARELRADGNTWVEIAEMLRGRYHVNARAALRLARGWSQKRAADEWCERWPDDPVTSKHLSWWECWPVSGHAPSLTTLGRFAELYECDLADLVADLCCYRHLDDTRHEPAADAPVNRREFLSGVTATAAASVVSPAGPRHRVGAADVGDLRSQVQELHTLDDRYGGAVIYRQAIARADHVRQLLDQSSYSPTVGRDLQVVAGQLTELSGWLAFDAGHHERARQQWTEALYVARLAENDHLTVAVMTSMCLQSLNQGQGPEALDLAQAAQRIARPFATPRLLSTLAAREARARALLRDAAGCHTTLLRAEQLLDEGTNEDDEEWLAFWGPADFYCAVAAAHMSLGARTEAEHASRAALATVNPAYPRNQALYLADLAETLAVQDQLDEAATLASAALSKLPDVSSGRLRHDLRSLGTRLEQHRGVPAVRQYLDELDRTLVAGAS